MKGKHFLSVADLPSEGVAQLVERAYNMKRGKGRATACGQRVRAHLREALAANPREL